MRRGQVDNDAEVGSSVHICLFFSLTEFTGVPGSYLTHKSRFYAQDVFVSRSLRTTSARREEAGLELSSAAAVATIGPSPE